MLSPWYLLLPLTFCSTAANATKVSLDPATKKPVPINPLVTSTPEEKKLFQDGEANYNLKKAESKMALRKQSPNNEESNLIHALWLQQLDYHGRGSRPLPYSSSNSYRSQHRLSKARQRPLDGLYRDPKRCNNATPIPEPPQLHDLWWLPPQIHLRASIHLRLGHLAHASNIHRSGSVDLRKPRTCRLRALPDGYRCVHGLAARSIRR